MREQLHRDEVLDTDDTERFAVKRNCDGARISARVQSFEPNDEIDAIAVMAKTAPIGTAASP